MRSTGNAIPRSIFSVYLSISSFSLSISLFFSFFLCLPFSSSPSFSISSFLFLFIFLYLSLFSSFFLSLFLFFFLSSSFSFSHSSSSLNLCLFVCLSIQLIFHIEILARCTSLLSFFLSSSPSFLKARELKRDLNGQQVRTQKLQQRSRCACIEIQEITGTKVDFSWRYISQSTDQNKK